MRLQAYSVYFYKHSELDSLICFIGWICGQEKMWHEAQVGVGRNHAVLQNFICFCVLCQACIQEVTKMCSLLTELHRIEGDTIEPTILCTDGYSMHGVTSEGLPLEPKRSAAPLLGLESWTVLQGECRPSSTHHSLSFLTVDVRAAASCSCYHTVLAIEDYILWGYEPK